MVLYRIFSGYQRSGVTLIPILVDTKKDSEKFRLKSVAVSLAPEIPCPRKCFAVECKGNCKERARDFGFSGAKELRRKFFSPQLLRESVMAKWIERLLDVEKGCLARMGARFVARFCWNGCRRKIYSLLSLC